MARPTMPPPMMRLDGVLSIFLRARRLAEKGAFEKTDWPGVRKWTPRPAVKPNNFKQVPWLTVPSMAMSSRLPQWRLATEELQCRIRQLVGLCKHLCTRLYQNLVAGVLSGLFGHVHIGNTADGRT